jgi:hypothetical protein
MVEIGDLVEYRGGISGWYGKPFTVVSKSNYGRDVWMCMRNGMSYSKPFKLEDIKPMEIRPKFLPGNLVQIKRANYQYDASIGIVLKSNQMGSIVRYADNYMNGHASAFIPNSKLKEIK